jgi:NAD-dependent dihydropyrimidine dehydrogenase PreA subunit
MLEVSDTSFIYIAECDCEAPLDKPNIINTNFKLPNGKEITCYKCGTINRITKSTYKPIFEFSYYDFIKFINKTNEHGIFLFGNVMECIYCDDVDFLTRPSRVNLRCPRCKNIRYVTPKYVFDFILSEVIEDSHGYWLEWYVWRQLKKYNPLLGRVLIKSQNGETISFEIDGAFIHDGKCVVIECKDTSDLQDTIQNLHFINGS